MNIGTFLLDVGLDPRHKGFLYMGYALQLTTEAPKRLLMVTKQIYPDVGRHFGITHTSVERSIRTAIQLSWSKNQDQMCKSLGLPAKRRPTNGEFLARATICLREEAPVEPPPPGSPSSSP